MTDTRIEARCSAAVTLLARLALSTCPATIAFTFKLIPNGCGTCSANCQV